MKAALFLAALAAPLAAQPPAVSFVEVAPRVRLEVLDWGGSGRAVILLAGSGNTAHVFDDFAPKLAAFAHAYGISTHSPTPAIFRRAIRLQGAVPKSPGSDANSRAAAGSRRRREEARLLRDPCARPGTVRIFGRSARIPAQERRGSAPASRRSTAPPKRIPTAGSPA